MAMHLAMDHTGGGTLGLTIAKPADRGGFDDEPAQSDPLPFVALVEREKDFRVEATLSPMDMHPSLSGNAAQSKTEPPQAQTVDPDGSSSASRVDVQAEPVTYHAGQGGEALQFSQSRLGESVDSWHLASIVGALPGAVSPAAASGSSVQHAALPKQNAKPGSIPAEFPIAAVRADHLISGSVQEDGHVPRPSHATTNEAALSDALSDPRFTWPFSPHQEVVGSGLSGPPGMGLPTAATYRGDIPTESQAKTGRDDAPRSSLGMRNSAVNEQQNRLGPVGVEPTVPPVSANALSERAEGSKSIEMPVYRVHVSRQPDSITQPFGAADVTVAVRSGTLVSSAGTGPLVANPRASLPSASHGDVTQSHRFSGRVLSGPPQIIGSQEVKITAYGGMPPAGDRPRMDMRSGLPSFAPGDVELSPASLSRQDGLSAVASVPQQGSASSVMPPVTLSAEMISQVTAKLGRPMTDTRSVDVDLNPSELGRLKISLMSHDGTVLVHMHAERPETLDLIRRHGDMLARALQDVGYDGVNFSFSDGHNGAGQPKAQQENVTGHSRLHSENSGRVQGPPDATPAPMPTGDRVDILI